MSRDLPPSRTADQFVVRFPDGMRDQIAEAAKAGNRSMNAEIIARLQASFGAHAGQALAAPGGMANQDLDRQITEMNERIASIANALEGAGLIAKQVGVVRIPKIKKG